MAVIRSPRHSSNEKDSMTYWLWGISLLIALLVGRMTVDTGVPMSQLALLDTSAYEEVEVEAPRKLKGGGDNNNNNRSSNKKRLGDGCLNVYLDVGANIGIHTRFIFEPEQYPNARYTFKKLDKVFGKDRDKRDMCTFGFEPNPAHKKRHTDLEKSYKKMGWRYKYIQAGASDSESTLTFWHQARDSIGKNNEQGFGTVQRNKNDVPEEVPLVHLANWIQEHILDRELPKKVYGKYDWYDRSNPQGKVMMKIDIEGSEYVVFPSLIYSGVLCKMDFVTGEDHDMYGIRFEREAMDPENDEVQGQLSFSTKDEVNGFVNTLMVKGLQSINPADCKVKWENVDDERYSFDKIPYPTANK